MINKTVLCIIIYNRYDNLVHWIDCWEKCDQGARMIVIHNLCEEPERFQKLCQQNGITYIPRINHGFDIGAFQDVVNGRLDIGEWERLLWCTDDTFPMHKDFLSQFEKAMQPGVGVAAMDISPYVTTHIRTTGFMIDKKTAQKLRFPADPIITKQHCYLFEHRWRRLTFYDQVRSMGLRSVQVAPREISPMWDSEYHRRLDRRKEHENTFGKILVSDKILFICPIYNQYPAIISSLLMQTHENWELWLVHDGPCELPDIPEDARIRFIATDQHRGKWGHYIRQEYLQKANSDFVVITNADNYHAPVYCEYLLKGFEKHPSAVAIYCSHMVHSYKAWQVIPCTPARGYIDCAGVMVKTQVAKAVGWSDIESHSADWTYFSDIIKNHGARSFQPVTGCLLVHN